MVTTTTTTTTTPTTTTTTGLNDFLQLYVFCYFYVLQPICTLSLEYYTIMHAVPPIICESQNVKMPLIINTESQHATN
jgi:hypothetical protein